MVLLAVLVLGLALVRTMDRNLVREHRWGPTLAEGGWPAFYAAAKSIQEHAAQGDVVVSAKTSLVWFWTGLKGVPIPLTTDSATGLKALEGARWAIVDDLPEELVGRRYLLPLLEADVEHWKRLDRRPTLDEEGQTIGETLIYGRPDGPRLAPAGR